MKRNIVAVLLNMLIILGLSLQVWAIDDMDDAYAEAEAPRDMLAYVQSTFPYRFGSDLGAGDYVQYEITDHHSQREEPELCSLEVITRIADVVTIKEEFEDNILFYKIDLQSNILLEYWGYDEEGREHRPVFLSGNEVETRIQTMVNQDSDPKQARMPANLPKAQFSTLSQRETITIGRSSLDTIVRTLDLPDLEGITPEMRTAVQELTKVLLSEAVPKMLPAKLMAIYLDNPEVFSGNAGFVKQHSYQISAFNKTEGQEE
ncbi:MAG: hypothetical protein LHW56_06200 [Candidatus Cloacimonetes bacterium]|jgi:hypothetical protein|nr:hypothetical protein [Candidatus Cloacimonadota bacterium]MDY0172483.1 hypothetical protein [Candidatus Cloacimonadaceae bacterium]